MSLGQEQEILNSVEFCVCFFFLGGEEVVRTEVSAKCMFHSFEKAGHCNFQKCERYNSEQKHVFVSSYSVPNMEVLPRNILGKM